MIAYIILNMNQWSRRYFILILISWLFLEIYMMMMVRAELDAVLNMWNWIMDPNRSW